MNPGKSMSSEMTVHFVSEAPKRHDLAPKRHDVRGPQRHRLHRNLANRHDLC